MAQDQNKKTLRSFQCRDYLWEIFEQMSEELECSVDYLVNEAMRQYARSRNYGVRSSMHPSGAIPGRPSPAPAIPAMPAMPAMQPSAPPPSRPTSSIPSLAGPPARSSAPPARPSGPGYGAYPAAPGPAPLAETPAPASDYGLYAAPSPAQAYPASPSHGYEHTPLPGLPTPRPPSMRQAGPPPLPQPPPMAQPIPSPLPPMSRPPQPPMQVAAKPTLFVIFNGQKVPVAKDEFIIGRGTKTADLPIKDGNISRRHAAVVYHGGAFYMKDLGSTNGVEFGGKKVGTKRIDEGDIFAICDYELRFTYY
jgi:hypothetical protein